MKKLCLGIVALFASMIWISNVSALDRIQNFVDGESDDIEGKKIEENVYELKIKDEPGDLQDDIVIEQGETVTLDLNGKKLTNFTPGCSVIWVKAGGKLILKDSGGTGELTAKDTESSASIISNSGTVIMNGGKITSNRKGSVGILNDTNGYLEINGGSIVADRDGSTLDEASWGITNKGNAIIHGGTFIQNYKVSVIQNEKTMQITNGEFKVGEGSSEHFANITNAAGSDASLEISGGSFETDLVLSELGNNANVHVTGGTFQNTESMKNYIGDEFTFDANGTVIEKQEEEIPEVTTPSEEREQEVAEEAEEVNPDTADSNVILLISLLIIGGTTFAYKAKKMYS